jgi:quercetin dioxygenase-like cupin family protein
MKAVKYLLPLAIGSLSGPAFGEMGNKMKGSISDSVQLKKEDKSVASLFSGSFKVVGIGLMKGQKLEKHTTPTSAFLYVQSGAVVFSMGGKMESLRAGDYFAIPPKEMHEVEASEDSRLMLVK